LNPERTFPTEIKGPLMLLCAQKKEKSGEKCKGEKKGEGGKIKGAGAKKTNHCQKGPKKRLSFG